MTRILKFLFLAYHTLFPSSIAACRFQPTCSQYLLDSVQKHGSLKGILKTVNRLLSCQPLSKRPIIDPA